MRSRITTAVLTAAACAALLATSALGAKAETKVKIKAESGGFYGYVKSDKDKCANGRKVTLYKLEGNGYDPKNDEKIASDTAQANGGKYMWSTGNTGYMKGNFYAHARKIKGCKAGYSKVIKAER